MNKQIITGTMLQGSFFSVNKVVAKYLKSNDAALLLSHLIYLQEHHFKGEEFYQQQERLMEECNLSLSALRISMKILSKEEIISVVKRGTPAKNYYTINFSAIGKIFNLSSAQDSEDKSSTLIDSLQCSENNITSAQEIVSPVINILRTSDQEIASQRVYKNNNIKKEDKSSNIRDKLIKDKLYTPGNKIPQSFGGVEEYLKYLYTQNYG